MKKKLLHDLEYLNLYYEINNLNICFIDDTQFVLNLKDIVKIFPNNKIYDISRSYKNYLIDNNNKYFSNFKLIIYLNDSFDTLDRILKYFTGIFIIKYKVNKYSQYLVDTLGLFYLYEIE